LPAYSPRLPPVCGALRQRVPDYPFRALFPPPRDCAGLGQPPPHLTLFLPPSGAIGLPAVRELFPGARAQATAIAHSLTFRPALPPYTRQAYVPSSASVARFLVPPHTIGNARLSPFAVLVPLKMLPVVSSSPLRAGGTPIVSLMKPIWKDRTCLLRSVMVEAVLVGVFFFFFLGLPNRTFSFREVQARPNSFSRFRL